MAPTVPDPANPLTSLRHGSVHATWASASREGIGSSKRLDRMEGRGILSPRSWLGISLLPTIRNRSRCLELRRCGLPNRSLLQATLIENHEARGGPPVPVDAHICVIERPARFVAVNSGACEGLKKSSPPRIDIGHTIDMIPPPSTGAATLPRSDGRQKVKRHELARVAGVRL